MPPYASSTQIDSFRSIDMKCLKQWGVLEKKCYWGRYIWCRNDEEVASIAYVTNLDSPEGNHIKLNYTISDRYSDEKQSMDYKVRIDATPCHFGGMRWWFRCPAVRCGRRCRSLYQHGRYFVCRKCTGAWYDSQTWTNQHYRVYKRYFDADDYYEKNVKREYYNGKPTKKYQKYIRMSNSVTHEQVMAALAM